jgi:hypothetical protein
MFLWAIIIIIIYLIYVFFNNKESFENINQEIVISRYNEKLDWINEEPFNRHPIIIYNKGVNNDFENKNVKQVIEIENIGRESHTYLYHIIHNYDNLADVTIFLPGSTDTTYKYERAKNIVYQIETTNNTCISCSETNIKDMYDFQIDEYVLTNDDNKSLNNNSKVKISDIRPFGKWFEHNFVNNEEIKCVSYNSIFGISKKHILQKPKSYYEKLLNELDAEHPETGHFMERSWYAVFYPYDINVIHKI